MPDDKRMPPLTMLERTAGILLSNRFIWLTVLVALYLIAQLSYVQWQTGTQLGHPRFDTLDLMSLLLAIIEAALFCCALLLALGTPKARRSWYKRFPPERFSYIASGFGGGLVLVLLLAIMLAPVLYLHRYPELVEQANMRIPLMLLQRATLVLTAVLISYNLILLLRHVLRLPWWLAGVLGGLAHVGLGYYVTYLSYHNASFERLNYVFYYNHLWQYLDWVPKLQLNAEFHNIQMPYYAYFLGAAVLAATVIMLLWMPRASTLSMREQATEANPAD